MCKANTSTLTATTAAAPAARSVLNPDLTAGERQRVCCTTGMARRLTLLLVGLSPVAALRCGVSSRGALLPLRHAHGDSSSSQAHRARLGRKRPRGRSGSDPVNDLRCLIEAAAVAQCKACSEDRHCCPPQVGRPPSTCGKAFSIFDAAVERI